MLLPHVLLLLSARRLLITRLRRQVVLNLLRRAFLTRITLQHVRCRLIRACGAADRDERRIGGVHGVSILFLLVLLEIWVLSLFHYVCSQLGLVAAFRLNLLKLIVVALALVVVHESGSLNQLLLLIALLGNRLKKCGHGLLLAGC